MPQLVLCVVVLTSCSCDIVEGFLSSDVENFIPILRDSETCDWTEEQLRTVTDSLSGCGYNIDEYDEELDAYGHYTILNNGNIDIDGAAKIFTDPSCSAAAQVIDSCSACSGAAENPSILGTGCAPPPPPPPPPTKKPPNNSCPYAHDGECDEPMYCGDGTDCSDCGNCATQEVDDTCRYALDGECDEPRYCALGTDCTDCDYCGGHRRLSEERVVLKMDDEATLGLELDT
eukprot:SAG11_NODE_526_length_8740_cov_27.364194_2_plen_231_part_00